MIDHIIFSYLLLRSLIYSLSLAQWSLLEKHLEHLPLFYTKPICLFVAWKQLVGLAVLVYVTWVCVWCADVRVAVVVLVGLVFYYQVCAVPKSRSVLGSCLNRVFMLIQCELVPICQGKYKRVACVVRDWFAISVLVPLLRCKSTDYPIELGPHEGQCIGDVVTQLMELFYLEVVLGGSV